MLTPREKARRPGHPLRPALLLAALALAGGSTRAAAQQVPGYEEGIVEVVAERLAPLTVLVFVDSAGGILLPVEQVAAHLGLTVTRSGTSLTLPRTAGGVSRIDVATRTLHLTDGTHALTPAELIVTDDEVFLRLDPLALLIEAEARFDRARLSVQLTRTVPFPAQQRIVAEQRRAMLLAIQRQSAERTARDSVGYRAVTGAGVVDWELSTLGTDPLRLTTLRTQGGIAFLGGDLNGGATWEVGRDHVGASELALRYHRVFPRARQLTQVSAGDILTKGLYARFIEGIEFTNRPVRRSYELGSVVVRPDLPPGWEYEVFQGSRLLGFSESGVNEAVAIPLHTGTTPVEVRMIGPAGQEVTSTLLYQTPVSILPRRALEYVAGAGRCAGRQCVRYAHADLRYGATSLVTLGAGAELMTDSVRDALRPYLVSSFSTGTLLTGEVTVMPGAQLSATLSAYPRHGSTAHLRTNISGAGFGTISILPSGNSRWDVESTWQERLEVPFRAFTQLRFGASVAGLGNAVQYWRMNASGGFSRGYTELRYDHDRLADHPHLLSARLAIMTPLRIRNRTYRPVINATLGAGDVGFRLVDLSTSLAPDARSVITGGAQWTRERGAAFTLSYSARFGPLRAVARAVSNNRAGSSSLTVGSSAIFDNRGFVELQTGPRTGYAGLQGTVFVDRDGNGAFTSGDDVVPNARIVVGSVQVEADSLGRYRLWGLQPYGVVAVAVDSTRTPDPSWTTSAAELLVRPVPNTARRFDVPLIQTSELIGAITADDDVTTVGGLTLTITNTRSGDVLTALTFSDGQFYVSRVRPGSYRLAVAQSSLDALGAIADPPHLDFTIPAAGSEIVVELPGMHLRKRPPAP